MTVMRGHWADSPNPLRIVPLTLRLRELAIEGIA